MLLTPKLFVVTAYVSHKNACIKDTWARPKGVGSRVGSRDGWGGGVWWGDNGDNCT